MLLGDDARAERPRAAAINAESPIHTVHAHPTFAEAIRGATEDAFGRAIDL